MSGKQQQFTSRIKIAQQEQLDHKLRPPPQRRAAVRLPRAEQPKMTRGRPARAA